ncbi:MAG: hypothetical protein II916_01130 [Oscillospiraceae bacterium]|nr:hypothetical protein [Oscillospiraceae bacterium]
MIREFFLSLTPMLIHLVFWGGLLVLLIRRSNHTVERSKTEKSVLRIIGAVLLILLAFIGVSFLLSLWQFTNRSRVSAQNSNAKQIYNAFATAVATLDENGELPEHCAEIYTGRIGHAPENDALLQETDWFLNNLRGYYVIVTDENWQIDYTLWSENPITPDEIHPYTNEQQLRFRNRIFVDHSEAVGYYK